MAEAVARRTAGQCVLDIARLTGDIANEGTGTAGATTSITDATNQRTPTAQANSVIGRYLYFPSGTAAGDSHEVSAYDTIGVMTWAVAGTAPTSTTTWILLRRRPQAILDAMSGVTRQAAFQQAIPYPFHGLITNNLLDYYLSGQEWDAGAAVAPTGATLAGGATIAREATILSFGRYSIALTGVGGVGTLTRTVPPQRVILLLDGQSLTLKGFMAETTAADAVTRVTSTTTAGVATNTDRTGTYAGDRWEELEDISTATIALTDPAGVLSVQLRVKDAVTTYFQSILLYGPYLREQDLPPTMIGMDHDILMESAWGKGDWKYVLRAGGAWHTAMQEVGTTIRRKILWHTDLPHERHLLIKGYRAPDVVTAAATNVEPNPEWLVHAAARQLLEGDRPTEERAARLARIDRWFEARKPNGALVNADAIEPHRGKMIHFFERT